MRIRTALRSGKRIVPLCGHVLNRSAVTYRSAQLCRLSERSERHDPMAFTR